MIGYVTLGSNKIEESARFYDNLLQELGASRVFTAETYVAWSVEGKTPMLSIVKPFDGNTGTVGNGVMIALEAKSPEQVDSLH